jgi:hypothetical protein
MGEMDYLRRILSDGKAVNAAGLEPVSLNHFYDLTGALAAEGYQSQPLRSTTIHLSEFRTSTPKPDDRLLTTSDGFDPAACQVEVSDCGGTQNSECI